MFIYICPEANHNKDFSVEKSFTQPSSFIGGIFMRHILFIVVKTFKAAQVAFYFLNIPPNDI
jgi:hypothetical protein